MIKKLMTPFLAVEQTAFGIKCDNPECDWRDMSVHASEYSEWVNAPCPRCGANLMTTANYRAFQRLKRVVAVINAIFFPFLLVRWLLGYKDKHVLTHVDSKPDGTMHFTTDPKPL